MPSKSRVGTDLSADPGFKPKDRNCGRCGREFKTTAVRRYFCKSCFSNLERAEGSTGTPHAIVSSRSKCH